MRHLLLLCLYGLIQSVYAQSDAAALAKEANDSLRTKNFAAALALINRSIDLDNSVSESYYIRASIKAHMEDRKGAHKDLDKVLKAHPEHYGAWVNRGNLYASEGRFDEAFAAFDKAEALDSSHPAVFLNRGIAFYKMKHYDAALLYYSKAISLNPDDLMAYHFRAECHNYAGNPDLAMTDLENIIRLDSNDWAAKTNLGFCYITKERYQDAAVIYQMLYSKNSSNPYILSNYGYVKHMLGQTEQGLEMINKSLFMMPGNAYAYKYLALIFVAQNDKAKACEAIEKGLKLGYTAAYGQELLTLKQTHCP